jgi:transposase
MAGRRIEMRKLKELFRLRLVAGLSNRKIALCTGIGKSAVCKHVARAAELGLEWERIEPLPEESLSTLTPEAACRSSRY